MDPDQKDVRDDLRCIQKVKDAAIESDEILNELGVTEIERELVRIDPKLLTRLADFTARFVSHQRIVQLCRINGESPAGVAYSDSATRDFQTAAGDAEFAERYEIHRPRGLVEDARCSDANVMRNSAAASPRIGSAHCDRRSRGSADDQGI